MIYQPDGYHLAEFNFGTLRYPWDDPRIADFQNGLDQVNGIGQRSPGFIWRISDDEMEAVQEDPQGALADRPNTASTLSVWETPAVKSGLSQAIADISSAGGYLKDIDQL